MMPQKHELETGVSGTNIFNCICSNPQPYGSEQPGAAAGGHAVGLTLTKRPNIS